MKTLAHLLQAAALYPLYGLFALLPPDHASALGGFIVRCLGPHLGVHRRAYDNLKSAIPGLSDREYQAILREMWNNLGRVFGEYPHLAFLASQRTTFEDPHNILQSVGSAGPAVFISGHLANWEIFGPAFSRRTGRPLHLTYRAMNNPWAETLLRQARTLRGEIPAYPKGREGGRKMLECLREGNALGILIDQKYNEGIAVDFFGRAAMTTHVFVPMAQKYEAPIIPARMRRVKGSHFIITLESPLPQKSPEGEILPERQVLQTMNAMLESWIRENPAQWLWVHRRWPESSITTDDHPS
ncbi:MAG: hypothetical protein L6Q57_06115 [Alphaproteobacteria bacterium]|nr:hypothetical protein [Alphaproteobacteria bacterium]